MSMPRAYAEYVLEDLSRRVFSEDAQPLALRQPRILNCVVIVGLLLGELFGCERDFVVERET